MNSYTLKSLDYLEDYISSNILMNTYKAYLHPKKYQTCIQKTIFSRIHMVSSLPIKVTLKSSKV
jgi:hypothetical protein